jgi:hypothetical protein
MIRRVASVALLVFTAASCSGPAEVSTPNDARAAIPDAGPPAPDAAYTGASATCAGANVDVEVATEDLEIYPPYATAGCTLVYVAPSGELLVRDVVTGAESRIAGAAERPRRPSVTSSLVVWEATVGGRDVVRARRRADDAERTFDAHAAVREPRANGSALSFTAFAGFDPRADTDVWIVDGWDAEPRLLLGGPGQQRFAELSATHAAVTDFSEDPDGTFDDAETDLSDIVVLDRATGAATRRRAEGKQAFPVLLDGGLLAYLSWRGIRPEPKLLSYELRAGSIAGDPGADQLIVKVESAAARWVRPSGTGRVLEWVEAGTNGSRLFRAPADGSTAPLAVPGLERVRLSAPIAAASFTLVATTPLSGGARPPRLGALAR